MITRRRNVLVALMSMLLLCGGGGGGGGGMLPDDDHVGGLGVMTAYSPVEMQCEPVAKKHRLGTSA